MRAFILWKITIFMSPFILAIGGFSQEKVDTRKNNLRVGADGFTGIYRMVRPRAININSSGYEPGYIIEYITFLPGNDLYWGLPPEGLLYFDLSTAKRTHPHDCGTYEVVADEIRILRGPSKKKYVITKSGDKLINPPSLGKGSFRYIPHCDGLKLEGNYRRNESEPAISFSKNGQFKDGGVFRYIGNISKLDGTSYQDDGLAGTGTYQIGQNTLDLSYSDGRVKRFPFIALPDDLKEAVLKSFLIFENRMTRF